MRFYLSALPSGGPAMMDNPNARPSNDATLTPATNDDGARSRRISSSR